MFKISSSHSFLSSYFLYSATQGQTLHQALTSGRGCISAIHSHYIRFLCFFFLPLTAVCASVMHLLLTWKCRKKSVTMYICSPGERSIYDVLQSFGDKSMRSLINVDFVMCSLALLSFARIERTLLSNETSPVWKKKRIAKNIGIKS
jgi:hypothetical protein